MDDEFWKIADVSIPVVIKVLLSRVGIIGAIVIGVTNGVIIRILEGIDATGSTLTTVGRTRIIIITNGWHSCLASRSGITSFDAVAGISVITNDGCIKAVSIKIAKIIGAGVAVITIDHILATSRGVTAIQGTGLSIVTIDGGIGATGGLFTTVIGTGIAIVAVDGIILTRVGAGVIGANQTIVAI